MSNPQATPQPNGNVKPQNKSIPAVLMPLSDIIVPWDWNARSKRTLEGDVKEDENSQESLQEQIEGTGGVNRTPARARPVPGKPGKVELTEGFRRHDAVKTIAEKNKNPNPVMLVIVEEMSDLEARRSNLVENIVRRSLNPADTAFGVHDYWKKLEGSLKTGQKMPSVNEVAKSHLGMNQGYLNKLLTIMRDTDPKVLEAWRTAIRQLSTDDMLEVSKVSPKNEQMADYQKRLAGKAEQSKGGRQSEASKEAKAYETLKSKAAKVGGIMGALVGDGLATFHDFSDSFDILFEMPEDLNGSRKSALRKLAQGVHDETVKELKEANKPAKGGAKKGGK